MGRAASPSALAQERPGRAADHDRRRASAACELQAWVTLIATCLQRPARPAAHVQSMAARVVSSGRRCGLADTAHGPPILLGPLAVCPPARGAWWRRAPSPCRPSERRDKMLPGLGSLLPGRDPRGRRGAGRPGPRARGWGRRAVGGGLAGWGARSSRAPPPEPAGLGGRLLSWGTPAVGQRGAPVPPSRPYLLRAMLSTPGWAAPTQQLLAPGASALSRRQGDGGEGRAPSGGAGAGGDPNGLPR